MNRQRGYSEDDTDTPLEGWATAWDARANARRAFWRGVVCGGLLIGAAQVGTTVSLEPSARPGVLAVVAMENRHVNDGGDTGTYPLAIEGLAILIEFTWDADGFSGADRITVTPPEGVVCIPEDCTATVMEGFTGEVVLIDWRGM
jgi:hypothetical protein